MANELPLEDLAKYWKAKHGLDLTSRQYRYLEKEGKVAPIVNKKVDALAAGFSIAVYYKGMAEGDGDTCLNDERKRKTKAEADMAEMERDLMAGELVKREDLIREWQTSIVVLKTDLQALPKRLAKWIEAKQVAAKFIDQLLKNYSRQRGVFKNAKKE